jgi:hypothetical protein
MSFLLKNHSLVAKSAAKFMQKRSKKRLRATLISNKVEEDVFGFRKGEFLADLALALVDGLESLTSDFLTQVCNK